MALLRGWRRSRVSLLCLMAMLPLLRPYPGLAASAGKNVLLLASYRAGYEWADETLRGVRSVLESGPNEVEIWVEFMDEQRFGGPALDARLFREYKGKYAGKRFDLIVSFDDAAFHFLMRHSKELFPKTPIVSCGLNSEEVMENVDRNLVTGLLGAFGSASILEPALEFHPQTKLVYVVSDGSPVGQARRTAMERAALLHPRQSFVFLDESEIGLEEMESRLKQAPPDSLILIVSSTSVEAGRSLRAREAVARLARANHRPVYSFSNFGLGLGVIGWAANYGFRHGELAGRMATKLLQGASPAGVPVQVDNKKPFQFDYQQLRQWNIQESRLPEGSTVVNRPDPAYEKYKNQIWFGAMFVLVQGLVIVALIIAISRGRKAERAMQSQTKALAKSTRFLDAIINNNEAAIYVKNIEGKFLLANSYFRQLLPLPATEVIGKTDFDLLPREWAAIYRGNDERVLRERRPIQFEESVPHADGLHTYISHKFPLLDESGEPYAVCGISSDITARIRIERSLSESQERYKAFIKNSTEGIVRYEADPPISLNLSLDEKVQLAMNARIAECNDEFAAIHGFSSASELVGQPFSVLRSSGLIEQEAKHFFSAGLQRRNREFTMMDRKGSPVHISSSGIVEVEDGKLLRYWGVEKDITATKRAELGITYLAKGVSVSQDESFFQGLVKHLAEAVSADFALISETRGESGIAKTTAVFADAGLIDNFEYSLAGTPCANVMGRKLCIYPEHVSRQFPEDEMLAKRNIEAFVGAPMFDSAGLPMGLVVVLFRRALSDTNLIESVIRIFAVRAAAEVERLRSERRLGDSEQRFRTIVEHAPEAMVVLNCDTGRFIDANPNAELMFGLSRAEILEMGVRDLGGPPRPDDREAAEWTKARTEAALRGERPVFEAIFFDRHRRPIPCEVRLVALPAAGRRLVLGTMIDIRERKQAEADLLASRESLRALSARREAVREQERIRIAREIHDELGQQITVMKMELSSLRKRVGETPLSLPAAPEVEQRIRELGALMDSAIVSVRRIATDLRPAVLDNLGLTAAVEWHVREFGNRTGIQAHLDLDEIPVSPELGTVAFRILQEALTNVARHSGARTVQVSLKLSEGCFRLLVADDGAGIPVEKINGGQSLGLLGIRERAQMVNGSVEIAPAAGGGTTLLATLPLPVEAGMRVQEMRH